MSNHTKKQLPQHDSESQQDFSHGFKHHLFHNSELFYFELAMTRNWDHVGHQATKVCASHWLPAIALAWDAMKSPAGCRDLAGEKWLVSSKRFSAQHGSSIIIV